MRAVSTIARRPAEPLVRGSPSIVPGGERGEEDHRSRHGAHAYRDQRPAGLGLAVDPGHRRGRVEPERPGQVLPPEDLQVDDPPTENPDTTTDPAQPAHGNDLPGQYSRPKRRRESSRRRFAKSQTQLENLKEPIRVCQLAPVVS